MSQTSSTKTFVAITCAVAALFIILNLAIRSSPLGDWWLPLVLLVLAVGFGVSAWSDSRPRPEVQEVALVETPVIPTPVQVAETPAQPVQPLAADDLTIIEGIGPKISAALMAGGIRSFTQLSQASEDELRLVLKAGGITFAPSLHTWPQQAGYAARGDWDGLKAFQEQLAAGRKH